MSARIIIILLTLARHIQANNKAEKDSMKELKCLCFTDQEVEKLCNRWNDSAYPEYEGGNVIVYYGSGMSIFFIEMLREMCPQYEISDRAIAVYDYGNVIFEDKDTACLVIDWGGNDTDGVLR